MDLMSASVVEIPRLTLLASLVPSVGFGLCCEKADMISIGVIVPNLSLKSRSEIEIFCKCSFNRIIAANSTNVMPTKKRDTSRCTPWASSSVPDGLFDCNFYRFDNLGYSFATSNNVKCIV